MPLPNFGSMIGSAIIKIGKILNPLKVLFNHKYKDALNIIFANNTKIKF